LEERHLYSPKAAGLDKKWNNRRRCSTTNQSRRGERLLCVARECAENIVRSTPAVPLLIRSTGVVATSTIDPAMRSNVTGRIALHEEWRGSLSTPGGSSSALPQCMSRCSNHVESKPWQEGTAQPATSLSINVQISQMRVYSRTSKYRKPKSSSRKVLRLTLWS